MQSNKKLDFKSNSVKKLMSITVVSLMIVASFSIFFVEKVKAQGPGTNQIIVTPSVQHVTVEDTFFTDIYVNVTWEMNNVSLTNITFENPGILNYTNTSQGNLFSGGTWTTPENPGGYPGGGIYNASGYALPIFWVNTSAVNNTNATLANITWYANSVGTAYINITGSTANDSGTNYTTETLNATVIVHPKGPGSFIVTTYNDTQVNLSFSFNTGGDKIYVRRNVGNSPPATRSEGTFVCNVSASTCTDTNLTPNTNYSYTAWTWNATYDLYCLNTQTLQNTTTTYPLMNTTVKGYVNDSNGDPLPGVNVTAVNQLYGQIDQNVTDATGYYEIHIFNGTFNISYTKDTYYPDFYNDSFPDNATIWYNATLGSPSGPPPGGPGGDYFIREYSSDVTPRYITNNTNQLFNFSLVKDQGWQTLRLNNLTINLPSGFTYIGNNGTTLGDPSEYIVTNNNTMIRWSKNNTDGFLFNSTEYFWFVVHSTGPLGSGLFNITIENNNSDTQNISMTVFTTVNFSFTGSVKNISGVPLEGAVASMTVQSFGSNGPPITLGIFTNTTNQTGQFNITGIPTTQPPGQQGPPGPPGPGGSGDLLYRLSATEYRPGTIYAINKSLSLPAVPYSELSNLLNNPEMYLKKAITFKVNAVGPNWNWSTGQIQNYTNKSFQIMVKDLALGFPVQENTTAASEHIFSVPAYRNYSLSIYPDQSFPVSIRFTNIIATCDANGSLDQPGVNVTYWRYNGTYLLNVTVNVSYSHRYLNGTFTGVSDQLTDMRVVAYIMEDQNMVFENWALPFNLANESGGSNDYYNLTSGEYNISLPATQATSYIMLRAYATNTSGSKYMSSYIINASNGNLSVSIYNFTMTQLVQGINRSITANNVSDQWNQTTIVNTTAMLFNLVNSTGSLLTTISPFVEIEREVGGVTYKQMINAQNGQFNVSLLQGESIKKLTIYSQQYAPVSTPISWSVLSGATNTSTITCQNGTCNITMRSFGDFDPFNQSISLTMDFYKSNSSCNIPNPPANYSLCGGGGIDESQFSPFSAILKGDISMMISHEDISVYYINVDLLASGPPDAVFTQNASQTGLEAAWQFGSQGPDIYDYVLLKIPYSPTMDNRTITVKINKLYDNDFNVIWNASAGDTIANISLDDNLSEYRDYLNTSYEAYLNGTGVVCDPSDPYLQSGLGYKDVVNHTLWIKIPHFSGVGPTVYSNNTAPAQSGVSPSNGSTGICPIPALYVICSDSDGDTMNATWWSNSSGSWIQFASNTGIANNTNITQTNNNFSSAGTTYWWSVNVTDGYNWTNATYSFTTNYAPSLSSELPTTGATNVDVTPSLYVVCSDNDGDTMTAYWYSNSSGSWALFATNSGISSGTNITQSNSNFSGYNTKYWWSVNVTDGCNWTNNTYHFTTRSTIYVDDDGGADYQYIQDAVNNSDDGYIIYVYNGTYNESIVVNQSITLQGENKNSTVINGRGSYGLYIQSNSTVIRNITITNCTSIFTGIGVLVHNSSFIIQNVVLDNLTVYNNAVGGYLNNATGCTITSCNIYSNTLLGLTLQSSSYNTFQNNVFTDDGLTMNGSQLPHFIHTITSNTVNGKTLLYYKNQSNLVIDSSAGQILLANCSNISIRNMTLNDTDIGMYSAFSDNINISNCSFVNAPIQLYYTNNSTIYSNDIYNHTNGDGINLPHSDNNTISSNTIYNNGDDGIQLTSSDNNTIYSNTIYNNSQGIKLSSSNNNTIYNNNFNNTNNSIDDGTNNWNITKTNGTNILSGSYLGGNYWSDYTGADTDHDGLGDTLTPYNSSNNITTGGDYLPLVISPSVSSYSPTGSSVSASANIVVTFNKAMNDTTTEGNFSISPSRSGSFSWSNGNKTLTFNPNSNLADGQYTVTIGWNATDTFGNVMINNHSWSFTISSSSQQQQQQQQQQQEEQEEEQEEEQQPANTSSSQDTLNEINETFNIELEEPFYANDTDGDGVVDSFTDPNNKLHLVNSTQINNNVTFLISTDDDDIPEFFWDPNADTTTSITHQQPTINKKVINPENETITLTITVNKSNWIYIEVPDEYPNYNVTVKTSDNRTISSDKIWRKDNKIYVLDDPDTNYTFTYSYTILPPVFNPENNTIFTTTSKPTITITYNETVTIENATLNNAIVNLTTTDNLTFTFIPENNLTNGVYKLSITVKDSDNNTRTDIMVYTINIETTTTPETKKPSWPWIPITIVTIIVILIILIIILLFKIGYLYIEEVEEETKKKSKKEEKKPGKKTKK